MAGEVTIARESKVKAVNSLRAGNGWSHSYGGLAKRNEKGRGYARIEEDGNGKVSLNVHYDGYSGGEGEIINNLTIREAKKRGDEFLKNPYKYFKK